MIILSRIIILTPDTIFYIFAFRKCILSYYVVITGSQQPTLYSKSLSCGSSPLGIIPEGTSFMSNSLPSTVTCSFGKAYNPTSSKQILRAVFDDNVECVQDGKSGRADEDSKLHKMHRAKLILLDPGSFGYI